MTNLNIKKGRVENINNRIVFVADQEMYLIPFEHYKEGMLGKQIKCEVDSSPYRRVITKVL